MKNVEVKEFIDELTTHQFERLDITADQVLEEIARIAFSNMQHYARWGPDGVFLLASDELPTVAGVAIAEVSQTVTQHGGTTRIKLHDKLNALWHLARIKGFDQDHDTPEERALAIRKAMAELEAATTGEPPGAA